MNPNTAYVDIIDQIIRFGERVPTRQGGSTLTLNTITKVFDYTPLVTIRSTAWKAALREWEWFMSGSNRIGDLHEKVRPWWRPWDRDGHVPHNYSMQFRHAYGWDEFKKGQLSEYTDGFDQIKALLDGIREHPHGRRHVLTTWNASDMHSKDCPITNCHGTVVQFFRRHHKGTPTLDMTMYQRSCDVMLGMQHNWLQYWAFLLWVCRLTVHTPGRFTWIGGDCHIYDDHFGVAREVAEAAESWVDRFPYPILSMKPDASDAFLAEDFVMLNGPVPLAAVNTPIRMVV